MKTVFRLLLFFFFLSTLSFAQMVLKGNRKEVDSQEKINQKTFYQEMRDRNGRGENIGDFSAAEQRGTDISFSESIPVFVTDSVNSENVIPLVVPSERIVQAEPVSVEFLVEKITDIIRYLKEKNCIDPPGALTRGISDYLEQDLKGFLQVDEEQKAILKSQEAERMASALEQAKDQFIVEKIESIDSGSPVLRARRNSNSHQRITRQALDVAEKTVNKASNKIKSAKDKQEHLVADIIEAFQEIANSKPKNSIEALAPFVTENKLSELLVSASTSLSNAQKITAAKSNLENNRIALEALSRSHASYQQHVDELLQIIQKKHAEFLLEEATSDKAAQAKAKENKEFFNQKIQELEEIKNSGISEVEKNHPIMEFLDRVMNILQVRRETYEQLEETYCKIPHEERVSLLQLLESEQGQAAHKIVLGSNGRIRSEQKPSNLEEIDKEEVSNGIKLASLEILQRFGPHALHRFNNFFHTEIIDQAPLTTEKIKKVVESEEAKEQQRSPGLRSLFLSKDAQGIEILNKIYQKSLDPSYKASEQEGRDKAALICLDGAQVVFNPFAGTKFSKKYLVEEKKMPHGAVLVINEAIRNGEIEFAKKMTALKRHDVASDFLKQFNDTKNPLTDSALASFFKEQSEKQECWRDWLYYSSFSKLYDKLPAQYQINRQKWSIFQAFTSALKGQPLMTRVGDEFGFPKWNTTISTVISVGVTWVTTWLGDETRNSRKPPEVNKENLEEGSSRKNYDLREAANEFYDSTADMQRLNYLSNATDLASALEKRRNFVDDWLKRRSDISPDIKQLDELADDKVVDSMLQTLGKDIEASMKDAHQKLDLQGEGIKQSHYFSVEEAEILRENFKERQAALFSLEAKLPQSLQAMEHIWHDLKTSSEFFSEQAAEIKAKVEGAKERGVDLAGLDELYKHITNIQDAYNQLADAYLLKYKFEKRKQDQFKKEKKEIVIERPAFFQQIEELLKADSSSAVDTPVNLFIEDKTIIAPQEKTLALIQVFIENAYGLDAVRQFNENFSLRTAKQFITVGELRNFITNQKKILTDQGIISRSIYLPSDYSASDLYYAPDSENDKIIRSNGRNLFYNPFLSKELPKDYVIDELNTAEEGVKHALVLLVTMDFFKKVNSVNQQEILWSYERQFQGKEKQPLTVGAFKKFVEEETNKSQEWNARLYYSVRNPAVIRSIWSTAMSFLSGYRFQPDFEALQWEAKFGVTYVTDVAYESYGNYREEKTYKEHIEKIIKQMTSARAEELPIEDAYFKLQQIETDLQKAKDENNYITWRAAVDRYAEKTEEIKKLKEIIHGSFGENAFNDLEESQRSITDLSHGLKESPIFTKKELSEIQQRVAFFKEKFLLQQARSAYDDEELEMTQFMAANNALFFQKEAKKIQSKLAAARQEIQLLEKENDKTLSSSCEVLDQLASSLQKMHRSYDQLANAYASNLLPHRLESGGEDGHQLVPASFHLSSKERSLLHEGQDDDVISFQWNAELIPIAKGEALLSKQDKQSYQRTIQLVELSLSHLYSDEVVQQFQKKFQIKRMQGNPLYRNELRKFVESLEKKGVKESFYLASGHSIEQLLNPHYKNAEGIIKSRRVGSDESIDEIQEGRIKALSELEKTNWYQGLTELQQERVKEAFKEKYITSHVVIIPWKKWIGWRDPEQLEPLTANAIRTFVDEQKKINENWSFYYGVLNRPLAAVLTWNLITGTTVLARINNDVVRCHPDVALTTHFLGMTFPQYVLHVPLMAVFPTYLHLVPSLAIAFCSNYIGEQFNKQRQFSLTGVEQQTSLYRAKQLQLRERYESNTLNVN